MAPDPTAESVSPRSGWDGLTEVQQRDLLERYGRWLDDHPAACGCDPQRKEDAFRRWLDAQGVDYPGRGALE
ncbi:MAG: hypothetical protein H7831_07680 [Magnetococcus sp. WYHC-3]